MKEKINSVQTKIVTLYKVEKNDNFYLKWRIFSQPSKIGTGKNTKSLFFLLGFSVVYPYGQQ